ncbi:MAG: xanthine dehydrogenase accessory protein XdhC [FCB group bacterium]|jgi:xanthine dehydrogenase accessory factor
MIDIFEKIIELRKDMTKAVLCTVVSSKGSTPRKAGSKMVVAENENIFGTIGGGVLETKVIEKALEMMNTSLPQIVSYDLTKDLNMACGGSVEVYFESVSKQYKLYIFGAGHIAKALVRLMASLDYNIYVIDDRDNIFNDWDSDLNNSHISKIVSPYKNFLDEHPSDINTFIVIVTYEHSSDKEILRHYIKQDFAYIGMIGSKRKVEETKKLFISDNFATGEELEKVDMPIGLDIKAEGPEEIAISIAAKLILEKNKLAINPD